MNAKLPDPDQPDSAGQSESLSGESPQMEKVNPVLEAADPAKPRRIYRIFAICSLVIACGLVGGWYFVGRLAKSKCLAELKKVYDGPIQIQSVSLQSDGLQARGIQFFQGGQTKAWLVVDEIKIDADLMGLIMGRQDLRSLKISGCRAVCNIDPEGNFPKFPFVVSGAGTTLPVPKIEFTDGYLQLNQEGRTPLIAEGVQGQLEQNEGRITVRSTVAQLAGGNWTVDGHVETDQSFKLTASSNQVNVSSDQWMQWPLVPQAIVQPLKFTGQTSASFQLTAGADQTMQLTAAFAPTNIRFSVPRFDLDLLIQSAEVRIVNGKMIVHNAKGRMDDGVILGAGETDFLAWPITGTFEGNVVDLPVSGIRTLASIPDAASGDATATGSGGYTVGGDHGFTFWLDTQGIVKQATFENVAMESASVNVQVKDLTLDKQFALTHLEGMVKVDAEAKQLQIGQFFQDLGLIQGDDHPLASKFGGQTNAVVDLGIPLESFQNMQTWDLTVTTDRGQVQLANETLADVSSKFLIQDGRLKFQQVTGVDDLTEQKMNRFGQSATLPFSSTPANRGSTQAATVVDAGDFSTSDPPVLPAEKRAGHVYVQGSWPLPTSVRFVSGSKKFQGENQSQDDQDKAAVAPPGVELSNQVLTDSVGGKIEDDAVQEGAQDGAQDTAATASFKVEGSQLSVRWLLSIAKDYSVDVKKMLSALVPGSDVNLSNVGGMVTLNAEVQIPAATSQDVSTWKIVCQVTSGNLTIDDHQVDNIVADFQLVDHVVSLKQFSGIVDSVGQLEISADVPFDLANAAKVDVKIQQLPVDWLVNIGRKTSDSFDQFATQAGFGKSPQPLQGTLTLQLDLVRPAVGLDVAVGWRMNANIESNALVVRQKAIISLSTVFSVDPRSIEIRKFVADFADGGQIKTTGRWPLMVDGGGGKEGAQGQLGGGHGELNVQWMKLPLQWLLGSQPINVNDPLSAAGSQVSWGLFFAQGIDSNLLDGQATVVRKPDLSILVQSVVSTKRLALVTSSGLVDFGVVVCDVRASIPIAAENFFSDFSANLELRPIDATLGQVGLKGISGQVDVSQGVAKVNLWTNAFEGKIAAKGDFLLGQVDSVSRPDQSVDVTGNGLKLSQMISLLAPMEATKGLDGKVDLDGVFRFDGSSWIPEGGGDLVVERLTWQGRLLANQSLLGIKVSGNLFSVSRFRSDFGGGELSGVLQIPISGGQPGTYELNLRRIRLDALAMPWISSKNRRQTLDALVDARLNGTVGDRLTGAGRVGLSKAKSLGFGAKEFSVPVGYQINLRTLQGKAEIRQTHLRAFDGDLSGKASIEFGRSFDVDARVKLNRIDSGELFGSALGSADADQGMLYGQLSVSGRSVRSIDDLQGKFTGRLERSKSFQVPLLRTMAIFLNSSQLVQQDFDSDDINLTLSNGRVKVNRFTFSNSAAQVIVTGSLTTQGLLDLDVAARIANLNGGGQLLASVSGSPLAAVVSPTGAAIGRVTEFLSNRVIYLHVGGGAKSPNFQLRTGQVLRDEVVQSFLRKSNLPNLSNLSNNP